MQYSQDPLVSCDFYTVLVTTRIYPHKKLTDPKATDSGISIHPSEESPTLLMSVLLIVVTAVFSKPMFVLSTKDSRIYQYPYSNAPAVICRVNMLAFGIYLS